MHRITHDQEGIVKGWRPTSLCLEHKRGFELDLLSWLSQRSIMILFHMFLDSLREVGPI